MQSDREKLEGLPVAPFMDRDKITKPTAQIGFIKFVLTPVFESMNKVRLIPRPRFGIVPFTVCSQAYFTVCSQAYFTVCSQIRVLTRFTPCLN